MDRKVAALVACSIAFGPVAEAGPISQARIQELMGSRDRQEVTFEALRSRDKDILIQLGGMLSSKYAELLEGSEMVFTRLIENGTVFYRMDFIGLKGKDRARALCEILDVEKCISLGKYGQMTLLQADGDVIVSATGIVEDNRPFGVSGNEPQESYNPQARVIEERVRKMLDPLGIFPIPRPKTVIDIPDVVTTPLADQSRNTTAPQAPEKPSVQIELPVARPVEPEVEEQGPSAEVEAEALRALPVAALEREGDASADISIMEYYDEDESIGELVAVDAGGDAAQAIPSLPTSSEAIAFEDAPSLTSPDADEVELEAVTLDVPVSIPTQPELIAQPEDSENLPTVDDTLVEPTETGADFISPDDQAQLRSRFFKDDAAGEPIDVADSFLKSAFGSGPGNIGMGGRPTDVAMRLPGIGQVDIGVLDGGTPGFSKDGSARFPTPKRVIARAPRTAPVPVATARTLQVPKAVDIPAELQEVIVADLTPDPIKFVAAPDPVDRSVAQRDFEERTRVRVAREYEVAQAAERAEEGRLAQAAAIEDQRLLEVAQAQALEQERLAQAAEADRIEEERLVAIAAAEAADQAEILRVAAAQAENDRIASIEMAVAMMPSARASALNALAERNAKAQRLAFLDTVAMPVPRELMLASLDVKMQDMIASRAGIAMQDDTPTSLIASGDDVEGQGPTDLMVVALDATSEQADTLMPGAIAVPSVNALMAMTALSPLTVPLGGPISKPGFKVSVPMTQVVTTLNTQDDGPVRIAGGAKVQIALLGKVSFDDQFAVPASIDFSNGRDAGRLQKMPEPRPDIEAYTRVASQARGVDIDTARLALDVSRGVRGAATLAQVPGLMPSSQGDTGIAPPGFFDDSDIVSEPFRLAPQSPSMARLDDLLSDPAPTIETPVRPVDANFNPTTIFGAAADEAESDQPVIQKEDITAAPVHAAVISEPAAASDLVRPTGLDALRALTQTPVPNGNVAPIAAPAVTPPVLDEIVDAPRLVVTPPVLVVATQPAPEIQAPVAAAAPALPAKAEPTAGLTQAQTQALDILRQIAEASQTNADYEAMPQASAPTPQSAPSVPQTAFSSAVDVAEHSGDRTIVDRAQSFDPSNDQFDTKDLRIELSYVGSREEVMARAKELKEFFPTVILEKGRFFGAAVPGRQGRFVVGIEAHDLKSRDDLVWYMDQMGVPWTMRD